MSNGSGGAPNEQRVSWSLSGVFYSITLALSVCGVVLGAYWNTLQIVNSQQVALAGIEARLVVAEKALQTRADAEERFASEMRAALSVISSGVVDLRVQLAKDGKK